MKKFEETVRFEVGSVYRSYYYGITASVTSRTPKFVFVTLDTDNDTTADYCGNDYKCKVTINEYNVERICLKDFWGKDDNLTFAADTEYVAIIDDDDEEVPDPFDVCFDKSPAPIAIISGVDDDGTNDDVDEEEFSIDTPAVEEEEDDDELIDPPEISPILNHSSNNNVYYLNFADRQSAINHIEKYLPEFIIDSKYKVFDGVFATNIFGDELELHDDFIRIKVTRDKLTTITFCYLDIPESRFIAKLKEVTFDALNRFEDVGSFQITGNSGTVYTFDGRTFEVIAREVPVDNSTIEEVEPQIVPEPVIDEPEEVKLSDYILRERFKAQHSIILKATCKLSA